MFAFDISLSDYSAQMVLEFQFAVSVLMDDRMFGYSSPSQPHPEAPHWRRAATKAAAAHCRWVGGPRHLGRSLVGASTHLNRRRWNRWNPAIGPFEGANLRLLVFGCIRTGVFQKFIY